MPKRTYRKKHEPIDWTNRPLRTAYTIHSCRICGLVIECLQKYIDAGGEHALAHEECVQAMAVAAEARGE